MIKTMNIYISGDSFCHWRSDTEKHWPSIVASKFGAKLHGGGFMGMGFWPVRQNLLIYKNSKYFDETDLFVFCHTTPSRMLSNRLSIIGGKHVGQTLRLPEKEQDNITEVYFKYIYNEDIQNWAYKMWLAELNSVLVGKKVIHLPCIIESKKLVDSISIGAKMDMTLVDVGVSGVLHEQGRTFKDWASHSQDIPKEWFQDRPNHFTDNSNNQLAQYVIDVYNDMDENTNKTYPIYIE